MWLFFLMTIKPLANDHVVLVGGLFRSGFLTNSLKTKLSEKRYNVEVISYGTLFKDFEDVKREAFEKIDKTIEEQMSDAGDTVHFVAHSLGGLVVLAYLEETRVSSLGKIVLLGVPVEGTLIIEKILENKMFSMLSNMMPIVQTLRGGGSAFLNDWPPRNAGRIGVITGVKSKNIYGVSLSSPNDGYVTVASAQIPSVRDAISLEVDHRELLTSNVVAGYIHSFLQAGVFNKTRASDQ